MKRSLIIFIILITMYPIFAQSLEKHRVIILTDIEADPDDTQSLVRLLLYSNEIDIKGIVATLSTHMRDRIHPESINRVIEAYDKVQPNLLLHEKGYPKAGELFAVVKNGQTVYGMNGVGDGKDTQGSDWIISTLEQDDSRPLWISVWDGTNTIGEKVSSGVYFVRMSAGEFVRNNKMVLLK